MEEVSFPLVPPNATGAVAVRSSVRLLLPACRSRLLQALGTVKSHNSDTERGPGTSVALSGGRPLRKVLARYLCHYGGL